MIVSSRLRALAPVLPLLLALGLALPLSAARRHVELRYATQADFDRCTRDAGIDTTTDAGAVLLAPQEYVVHDDGDRWETAAAKTPRKKVFPLETAAARGAMLYVYNDLKNATFNGVPLTFRHLDWGQWFAADIPASALKAGENVLLLPAGSAVPVDIGQLPRYSFSTPDDGKTWTPIAGEIMARLALQRYPAQGFLTSDVIDLASLDNPFRICPQVTVKAVRLRLTGDRPAGTAIALEARSGATVQPDASWTTWRRAARVKAARFVQWRAVLKTANRLATPRLTAVTVAADFSRARWGALASLDTPGSYWDVTRGTSPAIVRSSFPFTYQAPSPKLASLRERWKLDEVVAPGATEMAQFLLLRNWVRKQWPHNEGQCRRPWDAIDILSAPAGDHGMCVHFGVTFTQCALALGFNARQIILRNHYVSEIWSNTLGKWVLMDVESVQPEGWDRYGTATYLDAAGAPLNGLEIHRYLTAGKTRDMVQLFAMTDENGRYADYERRYDADQYRNFERFGFPLRNDFLDNLRPWEEYHGVWAYHSNDYVWWSDGATPDSPEYSRFTARPGDLYWSLNQAAVTLTCTGKPDELAVAVDTMTPNLRGFRYRFNGGPWQFAPGAGDSTVSRQAGFTWPLAEARNTLEVVTQNAFGRDGIPTALVVEKKLWQPAAAR